MRILILVPDLHSPGGVSTFFQSLEGQFKNHQVEYFTRGSRAGVNSIIQVILKLTDYLRLIFRLTMNHYDLVHVNTSLGVNNLHRDPWFVLISKVFGKKVLVFFHGWKPESIIGFRHRLFKLLISCDAVVVLAKEFERQLRDWGYKGQVYLESTVVSREMECLLAGATTRELKGVIKILFLSRIEIAKGIYEAVKAFQIVRKRTAFDIQLVIAGDGTELNGVQDYIRHHEISDVRFCGFVSGTEKSKVLLDSDIYILPSYSEGMPISVLEAMLAGMVVVTRSTGGLVDFFTDSMGRITESKDPEVFANMLIELIYNPGTFSEISAFNGNYAKRNFTVDPFIGRLEQIYTQV